MLRLNRHFVERYPSTEALGILIPRASRAGINGPNQRGQYSKEGKIRFKCDTFYRTSAMLDASASC